MLNSIFLLNKKTLSRIIVSLYTIMAGVERIELPSKVLETPMLPLYHTPVCMN